MNVVPEFGSRILGTETVAVGMSLFRSVPSMVSKTRSHKIQSLNALHAREEPANLKKSPNNIEKISHEQQKTDFPLILIFNCNTNVIF